MNLPTDIERMMATALRVNQVLFRSQVRIGPYIADFVIPKQKIVIETDGRYWHLTKSRTVKDRAKDRYLQACGYRVYRFDDLAIKQNMPGCMRTILEALA